MGRVVTVAYGVLGLLLAFLLGCMGAVVLGDPAMALLGAFGGILGFLLFLSWALHPVIYRCPTCHAGSARREAGGLCSRCAIPAPSSRS